ncbi:hypothetical protein D3C86_1570430 [compost metagenome]
MPHRPLLDVGQTLEVEVAAGDDGDDGLAFELFAADRIQRRDRQRARGLEHDTLDVQHVDDRHADRVFRKQHDLVGREAAKSRKIQIADPPDSCAIDEVVDLVERDKTAGLEALPEARRA